MQNDMYDYICYSHSMTFLIRFCKFIVLTFHNSYRQERARLNHACPWCVLSYTHTQYKCVLIPYNSLLLGAGAGECQSLRDYAEVIRTWNIHTDFVGPLAFQDAYLLYSSLDVGMSQWSMFHQCFFPSYFQILYWCYFSNSIFLYRYEYVFHLIILILDGCC